MKDVLSGIGYASPCVNRLRGFVQQLYVCMLYSVAIYTTKFFNRRSTT
jgi:hypothetical protein